MTLLSAGVASVDITPPVGKYRVLSSGKFATALRDPLYAKALVLKDDSACIAIVSLDLVYAFPPEMFDAYRERLKHEARIDSVVLTGSHAHNTPEHYWETAQTATADELADMPWNDESMEKIYRAILQAHANVASVRIGFGYGTSTIGTNRRLVTPKGVRTLGRTVPDKVPVEPSDPRVGVLRIDREDGTPLAVAVHYACHPVALMTPETTEFSADYVGEMRKEVSARIPGNPDVLFWQGAAGDQNLRSRITGSGESEVKSYGHELSDAVVSAAMSIETSTQAGLSSESETLTFDSRWPPEVVDFHKRQDPGCDTHWFLQNYRPRYSAPVASFVIGRKLALVCLPGEPFLEYQFELDRKSPVPDTWLVGYCERGFGYLPTIRAATEGGYGTNDSQTLLAVGAGDIMIAHALVQIARQARLLQRIPTPTDNFCGVGGFYKRPSAN